jgi:hypothetical protein
VPLSIVNLLCAVKCRDIKCEMAFLHLFSILFAPVSLPSASRSEFWSSKLTVRSIFIELYGETIAREWPVFATAPIMSFQTFDDLATTRDDGLTNGA